MPEDQATHLFQDSAYLFGFLSSTRLSVPQMKLLSVRVVILQSLKPAIAMDHALECVEFEAQLSLPPERLCKEVSNRVLGHC
jgi:hypothetical protein